MATFDPENPEQVRLALKYSGVRCKRKVSGTERQRLSQIGFKKSPQSVPTSSQSDSRDTVEAKKTRQNDGVGMGKGWAMVSFSAALESVIRHKCHRVVQ